MQAPLVRRGGVGLLRSRGTGDWALITKGMKRVERSSAWTKGSFRSLMMFGMRMPEIGLGDGDDGFDC